MTTPLGSIRPADDGSFVTYLEIPTFLSTRGASIVVHGSNYDGCVDVLTDCVTYQVFIPQPARS